MGRGTLVFGFMMIYDLSRISSSWFGVSFLRLWPLYFLSGQWTSDPLKPLRCGCQYHESLRRLCSSNPTTGQASSCHLVHWTLILVADICFWVVASQIQKGEINLKRELRTMHQATPLELARLMYACMSGILRAGLDYLQCVETNYVSLCHTLCHIMSFCRLSIYCTWFGPVSPKFMHISRHGDQQMRF